MPIGPELEIELNGTGARHVVALNGEVDLASSPLAAEALAGLSSSNVVLDLRKVASMNSSDLELLVTQQTRFDEDGGSLAVLVADDTIVQRLLDLAPLADRFRIVRAIGDHD